MTLEEMFEQARQYEQLAKDAAEAGDTQMAATWKEQAEAWFEEAHAIEAKHELMRKHGFVIIT